MILGRVASALGLCALIAGFGISPAHAAIRYGEPLALSSSTGYASAPSLAAGGSGSATLAWDEFADGPPQAEVVRAVRVPATGPPGPTHQLSDSGDVAGQPVVAIDSLGRARVAWVRTFRLGVSGDIWDFVDSTILSAADGSPGAVQPVYTGDYPAGGDDDVEGLTIATDSVGRALLGWRRSLTGPLPRTLIEAARVNSSGTTGVIQTLSPSDSLRKGNPQLAIDGGDRTHFAWQQQAPSAADDILMRRLDSEGLPGSLENASGDGSVHERSPSLGVSPAGTAVLAWEREGGKDGTVQAVRVDAGGVHEPVRRLSSERSSARTPRVAMDGAGNATVVWIEQAGFTQAVVRLVRWGAQQGPGTPQTVSPPSDDLAASDPQVVVGKDGRGLVVWRESRTGSSKVLARRLGADGSVGPLRTLSSAPRHTDMRVALAPSGHAFVAWARPVGSLDRIELARGSVVPPETQITAGPADGSRTSEPSPVFSFGGTPSAEIARYECSLDNGAFTRCESPLTVGPLAPGSHTFAVRAVDSEGDTDPTPARRSFTVVRSGGEAEPVPPVADTTPPVARFRKTPPKKLTVRRKAARATITFRFTGRDDVTPPSKLAFQCKLNKGRFRSCSSPRRVKTRRGKHVFAVRAVDEAGNVGPAVRHRWKVVVRKSRR